MRQIVIGIVAAAALSAAAVSSSAAADMAFKAPPPVVAYNWTGFYVGGNIGASASRADWEYTGPFSTFSRDMSDVSFIGGGQIGYNWQFGSWLLGAEADIAWRGNSANDIYSRPSTIAVLGAPFNTVATDTALAHSEQNWLGTIRARLGYTWANQLIYVTGGGAYGNVNHSVAEFLAPPFAATGRLLTVDETRWGWALGAGWEALFGKWSVGAEYLYVDLGASTVAFAPAVLAPPAPGILFPADASKFDNTSHIFRAKLNYHF